MSAQDLGPLDWRIAITDPQGRPSPEFQRRWNIQRNNNALIGSVSFGSGAPTGTPADGAEYVDISVTPYTIYIGHGGSWHAAGSASANPTATAGPAAINGTASTFMRSDAAPAIQLASSSQFGLVKPDGTTITASGGVISSAASGFTAGNLVLLEQHTATGSVSELDFTAWYSSNYTSYYIEFINIIPSGTAGTLNFQVSSNGGSTWDTGSNYSYSGFAWSSSGSAVGGNTNTTSAQIFPALSGRTLSNATNQSITGFLNMYGPANTTTWPSFIGEFLGPDSANTTTNSQDSSVRAYYRGLAAFNAIKFYVTSGTFSGTIRIYGRSATPLATSPGLPVIQEVITSGSQASVTISGIPQNYRDIQIVVTGRSNAVLASDTVSFRINGDTSADYDYLEWYDNGTSTGTNNAAGGTAAIFGHMTAASGAASVQSTTTLYVYNYANSNFKKNWAGFGGVQNSATTGQTYTTVNSGVWHLTAAVTGVTIYPTSGTFVDGTVVTVYGIGGTAAIISGSVNRDVTSSRVLGTTYTNTTGRPIFLAVSPGITNIYQIATMTIDGVATALVQATATVSGGARFFLSGIVPPGKTYSVSSTDSVQTLWKWVEYY